MVGVTRAVLVDALPYADSSSIYWIYTDNPPYRFRFSVVDYRALEADHPAFSAIAAYQTNTVTVTSRDLAERVTRKAVTGSYFSLLCQRPHLGRVFDPSDDDRRELSAVLTYRFWTQRFGGDPSVIGRGLTIDGEAHTIVGVLERTDRPLEHNVAVFTVAHWPAPTRKGPFFTTVLARPRPGVSQAAAIDTLRATNRRLFPIWRSSYQDENATWGMVDLKSRVVGDVGSTLGFVLAAVGCVWLLACTNASNLLIARGLQRSRDLAIRGALGASRARLLRHVMVEAAMLIAAATVVGVVIAAGSLWLVTVYGADYIPRVDEIQFSSGTFLWLAVLSLATGVILGLLPALHGSRLRVDDVLRAGGRSTTGGPAARRVRRVLVAAEFALATPLLVAAVLVLTSLGQLTRVPVGVDTGRLLTGSVSLPAGRYAKEADRQAFWKRALERLAKVPGVDSAALSDSRPPDESSNRNNFDLEAHPTPSGRNQPNSPWVSVSPSFFNTFGVRLERGRLLDDRSLQEDVIVVDRAWANRYFPGEDVIGRRLRSGGCTTCPWTTIVGVVANVKWTGLDASEEGTIYGPLEDLPNAFVVLRTAGNPATLALSLRQAIKELDPGLALANLATGDELVSQALARPRYLGVLIAAFACTALVLSVVGIYGVMAYFVQQSRRDIGIRLALGGDARGVRRMVVLQGLNVAFFGVIAGVVAAVLGGRLMATVLFGVTATDPRALVGVPMGLVAAAILACLIPAQRAAAVDPAEILRE